MLQGCLGVIEGLLFVNSHLGNQGEGNHANCLKLSVEPICPSQSAVNDVTDNDYFYRTRIFGGKNSVGECTTFGGACKLEGRFD